MNCLSCGAPERYHIAGICKQCGQPAAAQPSTEVTL